jgi:hypothetical protein
LYQWCRLNGIRFSYAVLDTRFFRRLKRCCLPFKSIGDFTVMQDGTEAAVAVIIAWKEFERENLKKNYGLFQWFNEGNNYLSIDSDFSYKYSDVV